jgi:DNA-binding response OmpR family regulator
MRVLYVLSVQADDSPSPMDELAALDPSLEVHTATGAAAALVEIRAREGYRAVFLSPRLPANEALALVATLRRDRAPVAIVAIITESQRTFFAPVMTAGADDVMVLRDEGLIRAADTLARVRTSRHLTRHADQARLRVLYVGQDDLAWDLLSDMSFVEAERTLAEADGACEIERPSWDGFPDIVVVDEQAGEGHALPVVKWIKAHAPHLPVIVLTSPTGHEVAGAALELGADDVVSKAGTYRRRLVAMLHRHYLRTLDAERPDAPWDVPEPEPEETGPEAEPWPDTPHDHARDEGLEADEIAHMRGALSAETRIRDLTAEVEALGARLDSQRKAHEELQEAQGFERAMRERDREELARLHQALNEERERRIVLEGTLRQTEDQAAADRTDRETRHEEAVRRLEAQLQEAVDRLGDTGAESHVLEAVPFGWATVAVDGSLQHCNASFARLFGYENEAEALAAGRPFAGLADHAHVVGLVQSGAAVERVESVLHRADGRPFRALTWAARAPSTGDQPAAIQRVIVDIDDRSRLEEQLRLARRLEAAGRLAAEMSPEIEPLLAALEDPEGAPEDRQRAALLTRQLLAFSRYQAKPAGLLSLDDAVRRAEPALRRIAGDLATLDLRLESAGVIAASEDDVEQLLAALVFAAAGSLPYGGAIRLDTRQTRAGFSEHTDLAVTASGYGVQAVSISSSLTRLVTKCGGTVQVSDDPARRTTLHVYLPC